MTVSMAISSFFQGIWLSLRVPAVRRRVLAGVVSVGVVLAALVALAVWGVMEGTAGWAAEGGWLLVGAWTVRAGTVVAVVAAGPVLVELIASALLPAFFDGIYSAARRAASGERGDRALDSAPPGVLVRELVAALRFVALSTASLALLLLPGIGAAAYLLAQILVSARAMGRELLTYHFDAEGWGPEVRESFLTQHRIPIFVFGALAAGLCAVPIVQIIGVCSVVSSAGALSARLIASTPR